VIAVIVAGGKGTRLKPITNKIPKPMVRVGNKPILEHILNLFKKQGITNFIFALCYKPKIITNYFGDGRKFGVSINYTYEKEDQPLGTAGAILPSQKYIKKTFIVTYADILRKLDIRKMIKSHQINNAFVTLNTYQHFKNPKSIIVFNKKNKIIQFIERPNLNQIKKHQNPNGSVWSNASFYVLEPKVFKHIPKKQKVDFGFDVFPKILLAKEKIFAHPTLKHFIDIANKKTLKEARNFYRTKLNS